MAEIENLPLVITGLGLTVSILYYTLTLRNANKTRQAQLYMQVYNLITSREFVIADNKLMLEWSKEKFTKWTDFINKHGPEANMEDYLIFDQLGHVLEGMGVLVKHGLLDPQYVDDLISGIVFAYWETFRDVILDFRTIHNYPAAFDMTELLL